MPLSVKAVGTPFVPFQVPLKPGAELSEPPGGIDPLYDRLVTVTALPLCAKVPPHPCVIVWPFGKVNFNVQPLIAVVPVFVMPMVAPKPPCHWLPILYCTLQAAPETGVGVGVGVEV